MTSGGRAAGKVVVVTGAAQGQGAAEASALLRPDLVRQLGGAAIRAECAGQGHG